MCEGTLEIHIYQESVIVLKSGILVREDDLVVPG
jgi:hypothetical protein